MSFFDGKNDTSLLGEKSADSEGSGEGVSTQATSTQLMKSKKELELEAKRKDYRDVGCLYVTEDWPEIKRRDILQLLIDLNKHEWAEEYVTISTNEALSKEYNERRLMIQNSVMVDLYHLKLPRSDLWHLQTKDEITYSKLNKKNDPAFKRIDYRLGVMNERVTEWFYENVQDLLAKIVVAIKVQSPRGRKAFRRDLWDYVYIRYIQDMRDEQLFKDHADDFTTIRNLYEVRDFIGNHKDYGMRDCLEGEGDDTNESFFSRIKKYFEEAKEWSKETFFRKPKEWIVEVLTAIIKKFTGIAGAINMDFGKYITKVISEMSNTLIKIYDFTTSIPEVAFGLIKGSVIFMGLVILGVLGFLSANMITGMLKVCSWFVPHSRATVNVHMPSYEGGHKLRAEAFDPLSCLSAAILSIYNWDVCTKSRIVKWCKDLICLVAAGTIMKEAFSFILALFPSVLSNAIKYQFGTRATKDEMECSEWKNEALLLLAVSKEASVLTSPEFMERIRKCMKDGRDLHKKLRDPGLRSSWLVTYHKLLGISMILVQRDYTNSTKDLPFSIHVFAAPGVGKTLLHNTIMMESFGADGKGEIYTKPTASEYWDAYVGERYIFWDEFLIGPSQNRQNDVMFYLNLISTAKTMPPLASTESVSVGVKGTACCPKVVMTCSNRHSTVVNGFDASAVDRRRNVVVYIKTNEYFKGVKGNPKNLDLSQYTTDEIKKKVWLTAYFKSPDSMNMDTSVQLGNEVFDKSMPMSIDELIQRLKTAYETHKGLCDTLNELQGSIKQSRTPVQIMEETMASFYGVPMQSKTVMEVIIDFFRDTAVGEMFSSLKSFLGVNPEASKMLIAQGHPLRGEGGKPKKKSPTPKKKDSLNYSKLPTMSKETYDRAMANPKTKVGDVLSIQAVQDELAKERGPVSLKDTLEEVSKRLAEYRNKEETDEHGDGWLDALDTEVQVTKEDVKDMLYKMSLETTTSESESENSGNDIMDLEHPDIIPSDDDETNSQITGVTGKSGNEDFFSVTDEDEPPMEIKDEDIPTGEQETVEDTEVEERNITAAMAIFRDERDRCLDIFADGYGLDRETSPQERHLALARLNYTIWAKFKNKKAEGDCYLYDYNGTRHGPYDVNKQSFKDIHYSLPNEMIDEQNKKIRRNKILWVAGTIGVLTLTYCLKKLYNKFRGEEIQKDEMIYFGQSRQDKPSKPPAYRKANFKKLSAQTRNSHTVTLHYGTQNINVIPLKGRTILSFSHWMKNEDFKVPKDAKLNIDNTLYDVKLMAEHISLSIGSDMVLISFVEGTFPQFPNIVKKFISVNDLGSNLGGSVKMHSYPFPKYGTGRIGEEDASYRYGGVEYNLNARCYLEYGIPTDYGFCGTLIELMYGDNSGKLVGFHVAGNGSTSHPRGVGKIVTREELIMGLDILGTYTRSVDTDVDELRGEGDAPQEEPAEWNEELGGNIKVLTVLPDSAAIHCPKRTKIRPSIFNGRLPHRPVKQPSILHKNDPRAKGVDPIYRSIMLLNESHIGTFDENLVDEVYYDMLEELKDTLQWEVGQRELTFEEAIKGVPGLLCSINTATSPGWPLIRTKFKPGKKDFIQINADGSFWVDDGFEFLVKKELEHMKYYDREEQPHFMKGHHRFIGYMKDELVKPAKIEDIRTRMIFCNSLISNVAFRMKCGALLVALQNSWQYTFMAIGMNPNSYDMNEMHDYLTKNGKRRFLAGDFKQFDQKIQKYFRDKAYWVLSRLLGTIVSDNEWDYIVDHETKVMSQIGKFQFEAHSNHCSGGFFTTIINCLTVHGYISYVFRVLEPTLRFRDECREKCLGDDHVIAVSDKVKFTPLDVQREMGKLAQTYTSSIKEQPIREKWNTFDEVTFLGVHPVLINDKWSGAQSTDSLWESPQWTKFDDPQEIMQVVRQNVEMASQWGSPFFEEYRDSLNKVLREEFMSPCTLSLNETRRIVANRITKKPLALCFELRGEGVDGLTAMTTETGYQKQVDGASDSRARLANLAINERAMDIEYGLNSIVFRETVIWDESSTGTIWQRYAPFELLNQGEVTNLQNMPFMKFIYTSPNVEVLFQVNGNPFQQGQLTAFVAPLAAKVEVPNIQTIYNYTHVKISPNESATHSLSIPNRFYRSVLNTFAGGQREDNLGYFGLFVTNPLREVNLGVVTITISTRFAGTTFSIPRPLPDIAASRNDFLVKKEATELVKKLLDGDLLTEVLDVINSYDMENLHLEEERLKREAQKLPLRGEGASMSTTKNEVTYHIHDVVGNVPSQNNIKGESTSSAEGSLSLPLPLDKPPLASGSIPMHQIFPSNSKNCGIEPTMAMQFHPMMMHREPSAFSSPEETSIRNLLAKPSIIAQLNWNTDQAPDTVLLDIPLNSIFRDPTTTELVNGFPVGVNIAVLNCFMFWRGNVRFEIQAIKTVQHSGRLMATIAYGAPSVAASEKAAYKNQLLNYSKDNSVESVDVIYNASQEFLRTYAGTNVTNPVQDFSMGRFMITVQTQLQAPETVFSTIQMNVSVAILESVTYEMNTIIPITSTLTTPTTVSQVNITIPPLGTDDFLRGEGGDGDVIPGSETMLLEEAEPVETTMTETKMMSLIPCQLDVGRKFENTTVYVEEVLRRFSPFRVENRYRAFMDGDPARPYNVSEILVNHNSALSSYFRMWSGHQNYRFYVESEGFVKIDLVGLQDQRIPGQIVVPVPENTGRGSGVGMQFQGFPTQGNLRYGTGFSYTGTFQLNSHLPFEIGMPYTRGTQFFNVSVPFNTLLNALPVLNNSTANINIPTQHSILRIWTREINPIIHAYVAAGDDFKLQVFCPRQVLYRPVGLLASGQNQNEGEINGYKMTYFAGPASVGVDELPVL
nr:hypothetical protein [Nelson Picorna-like virus 2]